MWQLSYGFFTELAVVAFPVLGGGWRRNLRYITQQLRRILRQSSVDVMWRDKSHFPHLCYQLASKIGGGGVDRRHFVGLSFQLALKFD